MKFRDVVKILTDNGWVLVRTKGSHHHFKKEGNPFLATVPKSNNLSIGLLKSLENGTGLSIRNDR